MRQLFEDPGADLVRRLLEELREMWSDRGIELVQVAGGWRFRTRPNTRPISIVSGMSDRPGIPERCSKHWQSLLIASR